MSPIARQLIENSKSLKLRYNKGLCKPFSKIHDSALGFVYIRWDNFYIFTPVSALRQAKHTMTPIA